MFFGASRVYHSMIPSVFEEKLGYENVFVASSPSQPISGTYYYIKDMIERVHPQKIIIDVTYDGLLNKEIVQSCLLVYDRITLKNKIPLVLNCFEPSDRKYILGPCRFRDNILMYSLIKEEKQMLESRGSDLYDPERDYYAGNGFIYSYGNYETGTIPFGYGVTYTFSEDKILEKNVHYLDKCIELCQEEGVEVSLMTAPSALSYMYLVEGYNDAVEWYKEYAQEKGIPYYNLNYIKDRELYLTDDLMYDMCHTDGEGAKVISDIFADILLKEQNGEDVSGYFYNNLDELKMDVHRIAAVSADVSFSSEVKDGKVVTNISFESHHNDDVLPFYRVELIDAEGSVVTVLADWTQDIEVEVLCPQNTNFGIKIRAKTGIDGDAEASQSYFY